jgi:hypothetical protein
MIKFDTYRLLSESLGMYSLGVRPVQSMGIQSNMPGIGEGGLPPELSAKKGKDKGKPPFGGGEEPLDGAEDMGGEGDEMGPDPLAAGDEMGDGDMGDDMGGEGDEMGGPGEGGIEDRIAELEAALAALKAELGHGDEDAALDHDDDVMDDLGGAEEDLGDAEGDVEDAEEETGEDLDGDGEEGEPEEHKDKVFGKEKKKATPFMSKEAKEHKGKLVEKGGKEGKDGPVFMMKKAKKCNSGGEKVILGKSKKCDSGMKKFDAADDQGAMPMKKCSGKCGAKCKKCAAKMQKEASGYERPKEIDFSEDAWLKSIRNQIAQSDVNQKFSDGMRKFTNEDLLIPPPNGGLEAVKTEPGPGEVGYAPTGPVGGDLGFTAEAVQEILARLKKLEGN